MRTIILHATILVIFFNSCDTVEPKLIKFQGQTQGTYYAVTYFDSDARNFKEDVENLLDEFDQVASIWVENSLISKVNRNETTQVTDSVFEDLYYRSAVIFRVSGGAFDPTVGPLVNAWGFGFTNRLKMDSVVVDSLLPLVGFDKVRFDNEKIVKMDPRIQLDFNAIAQGYSVDLIGKLLEEKGIDNYLVDIGGEVLAKGKKPDGEPWKVGIEKPSDHAEYGESLEAIVKLENKAMATSGNYRKFYEEGGIRYSHTIDPKTGYPVQHSLLSVSVMAGDCATADGWATAFMVLGLEKSREIIRKTTDLEAFFIYSSKNGEIKTSYSRGFESIILESKGDS